MDKRVIAALLRLREPGFEAFHEHLAELRQDALELMLRTTDTNVLLRLQGQAQAMDKLISTIAQAEKLRD